jgi:hypothetical protein
MVPVALDLGGGRSGSYSGTRWPFSKKTGIAAPLIYKKSALLYSGIAEERYKLNNRFTAKKSRCKLPYICYTF